MKPQLETISARLDALMYLCFALADGQDKDAGDRAIGGAFHALGNALERECDALQVAIQGAGD